LPKLERRREKLMELFEPLAADAEQAIEKKDLLRATALLNSIKPEKEVIEDLASRIRVLVESTDKEEDEFLWQILFIRRYNVIRDSVTFLREEDDEEACDLRFRNGRTSNTTQGPSLKNQDALPAADESEKCFDLKCLTNSSISRELEPTSGSLVEPSSSQLPDFKPAPQEEIGVLPFVAPMTGSSHGGPNKGVLIPASSHPLPRGECVGTLPNKGKTSSTTPHPSFKKQDAITAADEIEKCFKLEFNNISSSFRELVPTSGSLVEPSSPQRPDIKPTPQEEICVLPLVAPMEDSSLETQPNEGVTTPDSTHATSSGFMFEFPIIHDSFERSKSPPNVDYSLKPLLTVPTDIAEPKITPVFTKTVCQLVTPVDLKLKTTPNRNLIGLDDQANGVDGHIHYSLWTCEKKPIPDRPPPWRNKEPAHQFYSTLWYCNYNLTTLLIFSFVSKATSADARRTISKGSRVYLSSTSDLGTSPKRRIAFECSCGWFGRRLTFFRGGSVLELLSNKK